MGYGSPRGLAPGGPRPVVPGPGGFGGPSGFSGPGNPLGGQQPPVGPSFTGQSPGGQAPNGHASNGPSFNGQAPGGAPDKGGQSGPLGLVGGPGGYSAGAPGVSLADAVQSAHEEGQAFGDSVARDAPALWLEAVLARKPRMPSDLEARLLQGTRCAAVSGTPWSALVANWLLRRDPDAIWTRKPRKGVTYSRNARQTGMN
jgi:hypothetical protein